MIGILMEYCEGKSLDAVVKESRERGLRSSEKILGKIAVAVLRGLDYLHERKIIHRGRSAIWDGSGGGRGALKLLMISLFDARPRHQALECPCNPTGPVQDLRLWCGWRARRLACGNLYRDVVLHGGTFFPSDGAFRKLTHSQPERILGKDYSIKSDVWSLGLSLLEVANNRFPFPPEGEPPIVGQFDLLNFIVNQDPPQLVDDESVTWTDKAKDFVRLW